MPRREELPCTGASVGELLAYSRFRANNPISNSHKPAKTCVRNPVEHLRGHSTQTTQSCWSYDNLSQLIVWLDNLRSNLEFENRNLLHHSSRLSHSEEGEFVIMVTEKSTKSMVMNCSKEHPPESQLNQSKWKLYCTLTFQDETSVKLLLKAG